MKNKKLNLIIIGSGHYVSGETAISNHQKTDKDMGVILPSAFYLRHKSKINNIYLCGTNGDKLERIKNKFKDFEEEYSLDTSFKSFPCKGKIDEKAYIRALNEIESPLAAIISVPDHLHFQVIKECLKKNIPFLIVKPALLNLKDFYQIIDQKPKGLLAMVDYHKIYDEANQILKDDINNNRYGRIHHISSLMTQRRSMLDIYKRWFKENNKGNINHYLGSHYIHLTSFITDATPLDVRATQQFGYAKEKLKIEIADTIQTQIRWLHKDNYIFTSYHNCGWADPNITESMTYQEVHLLTEDGHVFSDQRYRGIRKVLDKSGIEAPNPYFFNLIKSAAEKLDLENKYGFRSIDTFINKVINKEKINDNLPNLDESENVTAILEAADLSLRNDSKVITIKKENGKYKLSL